MIKKLIYWGVSVFFCILPIIGIITVYFFNKKPLLDGIKNSSEIFYSIIVLCGVLIYDLAASAEQTAKYWWWLPIIISLVLGETLSCVAYGIFLYIASSSNGGVKFLEIFYPYSTYIACSVVIFGILIQLTIGAIEKKNG